MTAASNVPHLSETRLAEIFRDGNLSAEAIRVKRCVFRLLETFGVGSISEFTLPSGRRADIAGLAEDGTFWIVEVKSCVEDFRADAKWHDYLDQCDRFYFAAPETVPRSLFPADHGLILSNGFEAEIVRHANERRLAPARRSALTRRFAQTAAKRLMTLETALDAPFAGTRA